MLDVKLIKNNSVLRDNLAVLWFAEYLIQNFPENEIDFIEKDGDEFEKGLVNFLNSKIDKIDLENYYSDKLISGDMNE